jgi:hypothetical protein
MKKLFFLLSLGIFSSIAVAQLSIPTINTVENLKNLSSDAEESSPVFFNNAESVYFHRTYLKEREGDLEVEGKDIWFAELDQKATSKNEKGIKVWERPYRLFRYGDVEGLNSLAGSSADGNTLYLVNTIFTEEGYIQRFVSLEREGKSSWARNYDEIKVPGLRFDGRNISVRMCQSEDILFVSMTEGEDPENEDLYVSKKAEDGSWSKLINLGDNINTDLFETSPFLMEDRKTLFFSSNGHEGEGELDIFVSYRLDDSWQKWSKPINLGTTVNSEGFDYDFVITEEGNAYFISNRDSEFDDIFIALIEGYQKVDSAE